jgi:hypothetical protein
VMGFERTLGIHGVVLILCKVHLHRFGKLYPIIATGLWNASTVEPGYTGHKKFVWAGQKNIRYKESFSILIPALIQIIPAQFC